MLEEYNLACRSGHNSRFHHTGQIQVRQYQGDREMENKLFKLSFSQNRLMQFREIGRWDYT